MVRTAQVRETQDYFLLIIFLRNGYYKFICAHHYISGLDIDECGVGNNQCHEDAHCTNTEGSYVCACLPGFQGDGYNCTG